jgi:GntR family transcriptional regulator
MRGLDRDAARRLPKYTVIGKTLRDRILTGYYLPGTHLPSESALQGEFGVSRVTIRLALDVLRRTGFVESHQGKGHLVQPMRALHDLGRLQGFGEMMAAVGVVAHSIVVDIAEGAPTLEAQHALQLDRGEDVVTIRRVRLAGAAPLSYDVSHFPLDIGRPLAKLDLAHADIFVLIETTLGVDLGFADLTLDVGVADDDATTHIGVSKGEPLLRIKRLTYDAKKRPIDFEYLFGRADAFEFGIRVPRW